MNSELMITDRDHVCCWCNSVIDDGDRCIVISRIKGFRGYLRLHQDCFDRMADKIKREQEEVACLKHTQ